MLRSKGKISKILVFWKYLLLFRSFIQVKIMGQDGTRWRECLTWHLFQNVPKILVPIAFFYLLEKYIQTKNCDFQSLYIQSYSWDTYVCNNHWIILFLHLKYEKSSEKIWILNKYLPGLSALPKQPISREKLDCYPLIFIPNTSPTIWIGYQWP